VCVCVRVCACVFFWGGWRCWKFLKVSTRVGCWHKKIFSTIQFTFSCMEYVAPEAVVHLEYWAPESVCMESSEIDSVVYIWYSALGLCTSLSARVRCSHRIFSTRVSFNGMVSIRVRCSLRIFSTNSLYTEYLALATLHRIFSTRVCCSHRIFSTRVSSHGIFSGKLILVDEDDADCEKSALKSVVHVEYLALGQFT